MSGYFCIVFVDFMLAGKKTDWLYEFFSSYDFNKKDSIILSNFKDE